MLNRLKYNEYHITCKVINPTINYNTGTGWLEIPITNFSKKESFNTISTASFSIVSDVINDYSQRGYVFTDANDTKNPLVLNSPIEVTIKYNSTTLTLFRGYISELPSQHDGSNTIDVQCKGIDGILGKALCPRYEPDAKKTTYTWEINGAETTITHGFLSQMYVSLTDEDLIAMKFLVPNNGYTPKDGTAKNKQIAAWWTPINSLANISSAYTVGDTTINLDTSNVNIMASGFMCATGAFDPSDPAIASDHSKSAWFYYDGVGTALVSGKYVYQLQNVVIYCFGDMAPAKSWKCQQWIPKPFGISSSIEIEKWWHDDVTDPKAHKDTWASISDYEVNDKEGYIIRNPDTDQTIDDNLMFTGAVYEQNETDGVNVYELIEEIIYMSSDAVTAKWNPRIHGGAGLNLCDFNIGKWPVFLSNFFANVKDNPVFAWELIQNILEGTGLKDEMQFWYDHSLDKFQCEVLQQSTSALATHHFYNAISKTREHDLDDIVSGLLVTKTSQVNISKAIIDRSFRYKSHTDNVFYQGRNLPNSGGWNVFEDAYDDSKWSFGPVSFYNWAFSNVEDFWGTVYDDNEIFPALLGIFWFAKGEETIPPEIVNLNEVKITIEVSGEGAWDFSILGCKSLTLDGHATGGAHDGRPLEAFTTDLTKWKNISAQLSHLKGTAGGEFGKQAPQSYSCTEFSQSAVNALAIVVYSAPKSIRNQIGIGDGYIDYRKYFFVREFTVNCNNSESFYIPILDAAPADPKTYKGWLLAPETYKQMVGGVGCDAKGEIGVPKCETIDLGAIGDGAAVTIGIAQLKNRIKMVEARSYKFKNFPLNIASLPILPSLGATAVVYDKDDVIDYTGIIRGFTISCSERDIDIDLEILDENQPYLGVTP